MEVFIKEVSVGMGLCTTAVGKFGAWRQSRRRDYYIAAAFE